MGVCAPGLGVGVIRQPAFLAQQVFSPSAPVSQVSKDLETHKGDQMAQKSQGE